MNTAAHTTTVLDIIPETSDTQTFRFGPVFAYQAGQALALTIPGDPKKRFYSISSSPTEKGSIAITIKADRDNLALYGSLFTLKKGAPVDIAGPMGSFTLPEPLKGPYCFIAGGSGVTPFRGMIKYIQDVQPATETWLLHSVRTPEDLLFKDEFQAWAKNTLFHYVPTFTRGSDTDDPGETGRIGVDLVKKHLPIGQGIFFLCGPKSFVNDLEHVLQSLSILPERIRREQW